MADIKFILRNISRNKKKSVVIATVSFALIIFLMYYMFLLNENNYKLNSAYETTEILVKVERADSSAIKKEIPYIEMKNIEKKSGLVGSAYYKGEFSCTLNEKGLESTENAVALIATSDITRELVLKDFSSAIEYAEGYDENIFKEEKDNICIISREALDKNGWKLGQKIKIHAPLKNLIADNTAEFVLAGVYDIKSSSENINYNTPYYKNAVYCAVNPFSITAMTFFNTENIGWEQEFIVSEAEYILENSRNSEKFKTYIKDKTSFYLIEPSNPLIKFLTVTIYDDELKGIIGPIQSITNFMKNALPAMYIIIGIIAFGVSYLMTQNKITDISLMRAMGLKVMKVYKTIISEMSALCFVGTASGLILCLIIYPNMFMAVPQLNVILTSIFMYLASFLIGSTIALALILKTKPIVVLTRRE